MAVVEMEDTWLSLNGINSIIGRGVVIHAGMDDLGKVSLQSVRSSYLKEEAPCCTLQDEVVSFSYFI